MKKTILGAVLAALSLAFVSGTAAKADMEHRMMHHEMIKHRMMRHEMIRHRMMHHEMHRAMRHHMMHEMMHHHDM